MSLQVWIRRRSWRESGRSLFEFVGTGWIPILGYRRHLECGRVLELWDYGGTPLGSAGLDVCYDVTKMRHGTTLIATVSRKTCFKAGSCS